MKIEHSYNIVILGLSITSAWGNGHATTYRGLVRELVKRGHHVLFLERDVPWYAANRDMPQPPFGQTKLYNSLSDLQIRFKKNVQEADFVIVGSYVPEGIIVGEWVLKTAGGSVGFYDIDTPVTLAKLEQKDNEYLSKELIKRYNVYLSFSGGPTLEKLEKVYGSPMARPFYCSVDPALYYPEETTRTWNLGYLGTYSQDRQPALEKLLLEPARLCPQARFVVAGSQYPPEISWPPNVERIEHLPPSQHRDFYNSQHYTLNITRSDMVQAGYSPSVRLFEAAACSVPIISDWWDGLDTFFKPKCEILISDGSSQTIAYLHNISEEKRQEIGQAARKKVLSNHTAAHRALELEKVISDL